MISIAINPICTIRDSTQFASISKGWHSIALHAARFHKSIITGVRGKWRNAVKLIRDTVNLKPPISPLSLPRLTICPYLRCIQCPRVDMRSGRSSLVSGQKLPVAGIGNAVSSGVSRTPAALWIEVENFDEQRLHLSGVKRHQHLKKDINLYEFFR